MIGVLFVSASILSMYAFAAICVGWRSEQWPNTSGKILSSGVVVKTNKTTGRNSEHYHPLVRYEYRVGGKIYRSNRIGNIVGFGNDKDFAERLVADFPENAETRVYYSPMFPGFSVLLPGMRQPVAHYLLLFAGLMLVVGTAPALFSDDAYWFVDNIWRLVDKFI